MSESLRDQLADVRNQVPADIRNKLRSPLRNANEVGDDGVHHINVWADGETNLGRGLSHGINCKFNHSVFGEFICMESFWHYIRSKERDDRIRILFGFKLNSFNKDLTHINVPNFKAVIVDANYQKILQYPAMMSDLRESELPFDCYFYRTIGDEKVRQRPAFSSWLIWGLDEIRNSLKEDRDPDFSPLIDNPDVDIYEGAKNAPLNPREYSKKERTRDIGYQHVNKINNDLKKELLRA